MNDVTVVRDFPRRVREIENVWIPISDSTRLAARIWLPDDAETHPVPAILEYLPYRKRDGTVDRDQLTHPYFAGHGYACLRVDMRGTGDSEGVCKGEYLQQEQDDCLEVLAWIAAQPWCSGRAGMIGISWGGFNGLQVAARRPPELKAVVSLCSTDDRYADDIHFMGGCILTDKLGWGGTAFPIAMTPPDPAIVGERWREMWRERLENNGLWVLDWFRHQRRDDFYRHGSICENYDDVEIPVYLVGGWADGYTNPIFRMLEHLKGPRKALVGPWGHKYPHFALPGPRIGFLQECLRWWDHWLKDADTGIMAEPMLRAYIEDPVPPAPYCELMPGRWVAEAGWPVPEIEQRALTLMSGGKLADGTAEPAKLTISSPQTVGMAAGSWCSYALDPDGSLDQRAEAGGSLVFETAPLDEDLEILGFPLLEAEVASDRPVAFLAAVLSAVAPDGAATRVSYGLLNLTRRESHAEPEPLEPGRNYSVTVQLNACGKRFAKGERVRLALSTAYWPVIFPAPETVTLTLRAGTSRLVLPVRRPKPSDAALPAFPRPESAEPLGQTVLRKDPFIRQAVHDQVTGEVTLERASGGAVRHEHTGMVYDHITTDRFSIRADDPNSAVTSARWAKKFSRGDWTARVETEVTVNALKDVFRVRAKLAAHDGDTLFHKQVWEEDVPRDLA